MHFFPLRGEPDARPCTRLPYSQKVCNATLCPAWACSMHHANVSINNLGLQKTVRQTEHIRPCHVRYCLSVVSTYSKAWSTCSHWRRGVGQCVVTERNCSYLNGRSCEERKACKSRAGSLSQIYERLLCCFKSHPRAEQSSHVVSTF